jgi:hypothetical protein
MMILIIGCSDEKKEEAIRESALASCLKEGGTADNCLIDYEKRIELERLKEQNRRLQNQNYDLQQRANIQQPIIGQQQSPSSELLENVAIGAAGYVLGSSQNKNSTTIQKQPNPTYTIPPVVEKNYTSINRQKPIERKPIMDTPIEKPKSTFKPIRVMEPKKQETKSTFKPIQVVKPKIETKSTFKPIQIKK